jgi:hypothetical protein
MWNKTFSYLKLWKNNLGQMKQIIVDHAEQGLNTWEMNKEYYQNKNLGYVEQNSATVEN